MAKIHWCDQLDVYAPSTGLRNSGKLGLEINTSSTNLQTKVTYTIWYWSKWAINDQHNTLYFDTDKKSATTWRKNDVTMKNLTQAEHLFKIGEYSRTFDRGNDDKTYSCSAKLTNVEMAQGCAGHTLTVSTTYTIPHLDKYTLTLKSNDSNNKTWSITKDYKDPVPQLDNKWPRSSPGYHITNYNTKADGKGSKYLIDTKYSDKVTKTLYAHWERNYLNITYNLNGGTISRSSDYSVDKSGNVLNKQNKKVITVWEQGVTKSKGLYNIETFKGNKDGYTFKGWALNKNATWNNKYYPDSNIYNQDTKTYKAEFFDEDVFEQESKDITLYAVWEKTQYKITLTPGSNYHFNNRATSIIKYRNYFDNFVDDRPLNNTHSAELGYRITGWKHGNTQRGDSVKVEIPFDYERGRDITLTAIWSPIRYEITLNPGLNLSLNKNRKITKTFGSNLNNNAINDTIEYELRNVKGLYPNHTFKHWKYSINGQYKTVNSLSNYNGDHELTDSNITFTAEWTELKLRVFKILDEELVYTTNYNPYIAFDSDDDFDTLFIGVGEQPPKIQYSQFNRNGYKLIGIQWKDSRGNFKDLVTFDDSGNAEEAENSGFFDSEGYVYFSETSNTYLGERDNTTGAVRPKNNNNVCELKLIWGQKAPVLITDEKETPQNTYCYIWIPEIDQSDNKYITNYKWVKVTPYVYNKEDGWHRTHINPNDIGGSN